MTKEIQYCGKIIALSIPYDCRYPFLEFTILRATDESLVKYIEELQVVLQAFLANATDGFFTINQSVVIYSWQNKHHVCVQDVTNKWIVPVHFCNLWSFVYIQFFLPGASKILISQNLWFLKYNYCLTGIIVNGASYIFFGISWN